MLTLLILLFFLFFFFNATAPTVIYTLSLHDALPIATTSAPVLDAALRARIPYLDITAEVEVVADTFAQYADRARDAGIVVVPAMAFYGGLGDLLATVAMDDWPAA